MKYNCEICNYETDDKSNFNKHLNSKAHAKKNTGIHNININVNKMLPSKFQCPICLKFYSSVSSLSRHKNKYCTGEILTEDAKLKLEKEFDAKLKQKELEIELKYSKQIIEEMKTEKQQLQKDNNELKQYIKTVKPTTVNISVKKLIQQNYPNAPHLAMLENYSVIHEDIDFTSDLIYYYKKNKLNAYLGDIIIKYYKKEDPKEQSLWSTDSSRLKYIIKELIASKKSMWSEDDKGLKINKHIIKPLLKYICDYCYDIINVLHEEIYEATAKECIEINKKQSYLSEIREQILNGQ